MGKTIGLQQLAQKVYRFITDLPEVVTRSFGKMEDAFDMIVYGASGNGKSNMVAQFLLAIIPALQCKVRYVAYEEGHGATIQETLINRYGFLEKLGPVMTVTDHLTFDELVKEMDKRQSPKIWIIDSLQAAGFTAEQCAELKNRFVLSRKRKIIIYISWSEGKEPHGSAAKSVKYYANIKVFVQQFVAFIISRYGGNKNYVINEELAKARWGKAFTKIKNQ